jgi:RNA polymerase sigma-70 factor (ECF subfamily)
MSTSTTNEDLQALYVASYDRLVAVVSAVHGSRPDAEEAVQDAFAQLLDCWDRVSQYDNPEAWLRRAALGRTSNIRRKARNGLRAMARLGPPEEVPPPSPDAPDLRWALAQLPRDQRHALVLVHVVGLSLEQTADELGVPVGTVKSRLSRGRAALQPLLREEEAPCG